MRRANPNPPFCSCCFQAKPQTLHIDFEAAFDGPVINNEDNIKMSIDDLIICKDCLEAAAQIVGFVNAIELKVENRELGEALEDAKEQLEKRDSLLSDLRSTNNKLMDDKLNKKVGRPRKSVNVRVAA